ncbi:beta strand repeat-containing protein [Psychromonas sp. KJ10-10]|uniref:beta strand repeat-containing protein n=1 Tax=Psychromonas sp. KJ10-10 TaxID=3391823 RepID=UPI0039B53AC2
MILSNVSANALIADAKGVGTITDEPTPSNPEDTVVLTLSGDANVEESTQASFRVTADKVVETDLTVSIKTGHVDTTTGDYVELDTTVTIPAGQTYVDFTVDTNDDAYAEGGEDFTVTMSDPVGGGVENVALGASEVTTTINDEASPTAEDTATVWITGSTTVVEAETATYTIHVDRVPTTDLVVTIETENITTEAGDFSVPSFTQVIIPAGQTSVSFDVVTIDDALAENTENFEVKITATNGGGFENTVVGVDSVTTAITDETNPVDLDVGATVSISGDSTVWEGNTVTYTVTTDTVSSEDIIVSVVTGHVTTDNGDLTPVTTNVTIPAGSLTATFDVVTTDDAIADSGETFTASISGATGAEFETIAVDATADVVTTTIVDASDPTPPVTPPGTPDSPDAGATVSIDGDASVLEGNTATYTVTTDTVSTSDILVSVVTGHVTTDAGDLVPVNTTVTIPAGDTSATFTVDTTDDNLAEPTETYTVSIVSASGDQFETINVDSVAGSVNTNIIDNDLPSLSINDMTVNEDDQTMSFTVTLSNPSSSTVTVDYITDDTNGTSTEGLDYTAVNGTLTFDPNVTTQVITVPISDDYIAEGSETFDMLLSNATYATISDTTGLGIIQDEPTAGAEDTITVSLSGDQTVAEGDTASYTVTISEATITDMIVDVVTGHSTTQDGDLIPTTQQVTILQGDTVATLTVSNIDDAYAEGDEAYKVELSGSTSGGGFEAVNVDTTPVITVISDNSPIDDTVEADKEIVNIQLSGASSVEEGGDATYTISLDQVTATSMDIEVITGHTTTEDGDLVPATITVTVPANSDTVSFTVSNNQDAIAEGNEAYTVALTGVTTGGGFETINVDTLPVNTTIVDDDVLSISINDVTVNEDAGVMIFEVSLSKASTSDVTFNYDSTDNSSAIAGTDYTAVSGSGIITAGQMTTSIEVPITDDNYAETAETFLINLTNISPASVVIADAQGIGTINDDIITSPETSTVTLSATASVTEGGSITYSASVDNAPETTDLIITLDNGVVLTVPAGATVSNSVDVTAPDDVYNDTDSNIDVAITSTTGGNYEALDTTSTVSTVLSDDNDISTVTLSATPSVTEGGSITYSATVDNAPESTDLIITLDNGVVLTVPAGATASNSVDVTAPDDVYNDADSNIDVAIASTTGGNYEDLDTTSIVTTVLSDDNDISTITLSATQSVTEGGSITYSASVDNAPESTDLIITLDNGVVLTVPAGATASNSVDVTAPDDVYNDADSNIDVAITSTTGGNYEDLDTTSTVTTVLSDDNDISTITLSATPSVTEGGSITYSASVDNAPESTDLIITLDNGVVLTVPAGATASNSVDVTAPDDVYNDADSNIDVAITSTTGGNYEDLDTTSTVTTVLSDDNDISTVTLSATASVIEGGSITYSASVDNAPESTDLSITLDNGVVLIIPVGATVSNSVDVTAPDDVYNDADSNIDVAITSTTGGNFEGLDTSSTVTTVLSDDIDTSTMTLTGDTSVIEGGEATYTINLTNPAETAMTVEVVTGHTTTDNGDLIPTIITVDIPANASSATFNVANTDDTLAEGNENYTVELNGISTGGNFENLVIDQTPVSTEIVDNEGTQVLLSVMKVSMKMLEQ